MTSEEDPIAGLRGCVAKQIWDDEASRAWLSVSRDDLREALGVARSAHDAALAQQRAENDTDGAKALRSACRSLAGALDKAIESVGTAPQSDLRELGWYVVAASERYRASCMTDSHVHLDRAAEQFVGEIAVLRDVARLCADRPMKRGTKNRRDGLVAFALMLMRFWERETGEPAARHFLRLNGEKIPKSPAAVLVSEAARMLYPGDYDAGACENAMEQVAVSTGY